MSDWPFDQPENTATITTRSIVLHGAPILFVAHDIEDDGWQFLDGDDVPVADELIAGLAEMVAHDPTICELADLLPGWQAQRQSIDAPWCRYPRCC